MPNSLCQSRTFVKKLTLSNSISPFELSAFEDARRESSGKMSVLSQETKKSQNMGQKNACILKIFSLEFRHLIFQDFCIKLRIVLINGNPLIVEKFLEAA